MRVVFIVAALAVACSAIMRRLPLLFRLGTLLVSLHAAAGVSIALRGYTPNAFLVMGLMVVLVTLVLGRRPGLAMVALTASSTLGISVLHHRGLLERGAGWEQVSDSASIPVIIRVIAIFTLVMITFVVGISHVVDRSDDLALQKIRAFAALQHEQAQNSRLMQDLVQREAALEALNHTLEQRVLERTSLLRAANESLSKEMDARLAVEIGLRQAQKLESLGRLAAGVAHEINTPLQFVSNSVTFIAEAQGDISKLVERYRSALSELSQGKPIAAVTEELSQLEHELDLEYLLENLPPALQRSVDGLRRVGAIVRSLKEFSHPGQELSEIDLNHAIETTLTISAHEYKGVAEIETELAPLPPVTCYAGEINQALLNVVVNAAHAIAERGPVSGSKGRICVRTKLDGAFVVISVEDNGPGIPEAIRDQIFDPFFTTKEVGKGTGQGLAIARSAIHDKHAGTLTFESEVGKGTTFFMRFPISPATHAQLASTA
jgi:signal transduction histidine kinase